MTWNKTVKTNETSQPDSNSSEGKEDSNKSSRVSLIVSNSNKAILDTYFRTSFTSIEEAKNHITKAITSQGGLVWIFCKEHNAYGDMQDTLFNLNLIYRIELRLYNYNRE